MVVVNVSLRRSQGRGFDELNAVVTSDLSGEPQERLLEVVVDLSRDLVVLQVLLSVESDLLGLNLSVLNFDLVTAKDNRDTLADSGQVSVPVGDTLVCDSGGDIEHNNTALAADAKRRKKKTINHKLDAKVVKTKNLLVTITHTTELLLTSSVPHVELDGTTVGEELQRVDLSTDGG